MTTGVRIADLHKAAPASPDVCPDVAAEGMRVLEKYAASEGGRDHKPSSSIRSEARMWITLAERSLPIVDARSIQRILPIYSYLHSVAYGAEASSAFIDNWQERALMLHARGDKADKVQLMQWMRSRLRNNPRSVTPMQRLWYGDVLSRWVKECSSSLLLSRRATQEARRIIKFLLEENLNVYTPDEALFKRKLTARFKGID